MTDLAIETDALTKRYGTRTVVNNLTIQIPRGTVVGFVEPNGAGKTTTMRMLLGLVRPTSGGGSILGQPVTKPDRYKTYSLGMKQRLGLAAALLCDPELLILDEPVNGLDPAEIADVRSLVRTFAADGGTVFISSHLLSELELVSDRLVLINDGELVYSGQTTGLT